MDIIEDKARPIGSDFDHDVRGDVVSHGIDTSDNLLERGSSRTFTPAHITPSSADFRNLGLDVFRVQIDAEVALNDETRLSEGWHGLEQGFQHRWTRGRVPLPSGTRLVVIDLHPQGAVYWRDPEVGAFDWTIAKSLVRLPRLFPQGA